MIKKSLWKDVFKLEVTVLKEEHRSMPFQMTQNVEKGTVIIYFDGSLRGTIAFASENFRSYIYGTVNFYNSDDIWLKEMNF